MNNIQDSSVSGRFYNTNFDLNANSKSVQNARLKDKEIEKEQQEMREILRNADFSCFQLGLVSDVSPIVSVPIRKKEKTSPSLFTSVLRSEPIVENVRRRGEVGHKWTKEDYQYIVKLAVKNAIKTNQVYAGSVLARAILDDFNRSIQGKNISLRQLIASFTNRVKAKILSVEEYKNTLVNVQIEALEGLKGKDATAVEQEMNDRIDRIFQTALEKNRN